MTPEQAVRETTLATNRYKPGQNLWREDSIQFPRLLAEIAGCVDLSVKQYTALADSMDLTFDQLDELFDRAQASWERIKERTVRP